MHSFLFSHTLLHCPQIYSLSGPTAERISPAAAFLASGRDGFMVTSAALAATVQTVLAYLATLWHCWLGFSYGSTRPPGPGSAGRLPRHTALTPLCSSSCLQGLLLSWLPLSETMFPSRHKHCEYQSHQPPPPVPDWC